MLLSNGLAEGASESGLDDSVAMVCNAGSGSCEDSTSSRVSSTR